MQNHISAYGFEGLLTIISGFLGSTSVTDAPFATCRFRVVTGMVPKALMN
jgi:hypothetical protein